MSRPPVEFRRIVVIGGGCYGSWYTAQLCKAANRGALQVAAVVVVDRDAQCQVAREAARGGYAGLPVACVTSTWDDYLAEWLEAGRHAVAADALVPSPLMPHLCLDWLVGRARRRWPSRRVAVEPLAAPPAVPWERAAPDARHYVSYATWTCPVNCIEPARCPATRGPRDWSLPPAMTAFAAEGPTRGRALIFHCTHRTYGVGMIDARALSLADEQVVAWGASGAVRALVGTVSHCHGALGVLAVD